MQDDERAIRDLIATWLGGAPVKRAGNTLSVLRKEAGGKWVLFRDANMLAVVS